MKELRLHRDLYVGSAVDAAIAAYGAYATVERADDDAYFVVRVSHDVAKRERRVAGELANHALGESVLARGGR